MLLILNKQSIVFIYTELDLYKVDYFFILIFLCLPSVSISLCVHVCLVCGCYCGFYFCLRFSEIIRIIHCYYLTKNPCKREESLLDILSLESQTSFICNQKS